VPTWATSHASIRTNLAPNGSSKPMFILSHETLGMVVLDVLKGSRLGGIEFVDKIDG